MEDEATPSVILKYKTRKMAEMAMAQGFTSYLIYDFFLDRNITSVKC